MKKLVPALAVAALALVGCSAADSAPEPSAPVETTTVAAQSTEATAEAAETPTPSGIADEYAFATGMTFGKVATEGQPSNELDAYLRAAGEAIGEPYDDSLTFWTVKVDNREGFEAAAPYQLRVYDTAGNEVLFVRPLDLVEAVEEEMPEAPEDATAESPEWKAYEELFDLYKAAFEAENFLANPGAVKEFTIVTGDDLPDEIVKMTIDLGGMVGEADVITVSDAEAQGYPLDF